MSGGHFDYDQYRIRTIAETIESALETRELSKEVVEQFKIGISKLKEAEVYAQRIDWLLSGDDGEETFLKRLKEDLKLITANNG